MNAGETYYYAVSFWGGETTGTIPVKVHLSPIKSISL